LMRALRALSLVLMTSCSASEPQPLNRPGLDNAFWLTDKVLSGAQPEGDAAFGELAALGVKTIISVDGAKPDAGTARKHGLRTVHLPVGYDGVPRERALELAKAIEELEGPIYIHCHHGQHRGPAAAVVACVVAGKMGNAQAVDTMKTLGTGPQYLGLWASAREARKAEPSTLQRLAVDFRESAPVPPLAEAMVSVDVVFGRLQRCAASGWRRPPEHPDLDPPHEGLRLREIFYEIMRTDDFEARPAEFRALMEASRSASERLEGVLRSGGSADPAFRTLKQSCVDCHQTWRNAPTRK